MTGAHQTIVDKQIDKSASAILWLHILYKPHKNVVRPIGNVNDEISLVMNIVRLVFTEVDKLSMTHFCANLQCFIDVEESSGVLFPHTTCAGVCRIILFNPLTPRVKPWAIESVTMHWKTVEHCFYRGVVRFSMLPSL